MRSFQLVLYSTSALLALVGALPAMAQSADSEGDNATGNEIVVTAGRREQVAIDVPAAITALGANLLSDKGLTNIQAFTAQVPGLSIQDFGAQGIRLVLRGQNTGGGGASVATMLDDIVVTSASGLFRSANQTANIDSFDLDRIEVLRGPQGTLYGATAQGGLLKYVTRKPNLSKFEARGEAEINTVADGGTGWAAKGAVNIPLATDIAAIRVTGYYTHIPGYIDNPLLNQKDINDGKSYGVRGSLLIKPSEDLSIRLTGLLQNQTYQENGATEILGSPLTPAVTPANAYDLVSLANTSGPISRTIVPGSLGSKVRMYNGVIEYTPGDLSFTSSTSFVKYDLKAFRDFSGTPQARSPGVSVGRANGFPFGLPEILLGLKQFTNFEKFNQEIRASWENDSLYLQAGGFYTKESIVFDQFLDALDPANPTRVLTVVPGLPVPSLAAVAGAPFGGSKLPGHFEEIAGFADGTLKVSSNFELSGGLRYSHNSQWSQITNYPGLINGTTVPILNPKVNSNEGKVTWQVAPRLIVNPDLSIYGRVATGYRPGGPVLIIPGAPADFPVSYKSDSTINYEIGAKGRLGGQLTFDVALYRIDWTDVQLVTAFVSQTSGQTFSVQGNGGRARSEGFEWNFAWVPSQLLTLRWNGAYTNARLTSNAPAFGGFAGDKLPYVPDWTSNLGADLHIPLGGDRKLDLGADWSYVGKRVADYSLAPAISNHPLIKSYGTLDLRAGVAFGEVKVQAFARNMTNSRGIVNYNNGGGYRNLTGTGILVTPRTLGLRVSVDY